MLNPIERRGEIVQLTESSRNSRSPDQGGADGCSRLPEVRDRVMEVTSLYSAARRGQAPARP